MSILLRAQRSATQFFDRCSLRDSCLLGVSLLKAMRVRIVRVMPAVIFLFVSAMSATAAENEFPAEWYFKQMDEMRASLEGGPAIELSTDTWIGDSTTLDDCRGKVVVLDFWATWCGPCVASIPKNIELVNAFKDDLVFIGVHSSTSGWDKAPEMVEERQINYPVVLDTGETSAAYGVNAFPTYVIIDRSGIVRAAGVQPGHVEDIVKRLFEESGSAVEENQLASFNRNWFYGGSSRMKTWQEQLGQTAHPVKANAWWTPGDVEAAGIARNGVNEGNQGEDETEDNISDNNQLADVLADAPDGQHEADLDGVVRVLHFTRPGMTITQNQLKALSKMAAKYAPQGVVFTVVCDSESDWKATRTFASQHELIIPMALDAAAKSEPDVKIREAGLTAQSYHVRVAPVTVVVDRRGSIRATGLKLEQLSKALELLLSERAG